MDTPSIHDQFEEIMGYVMQKCEDELKHYPMTHALTAYEEAPACENLDKPAKFEYWEDAVATKSFPAGIPGKDLHGNTSDQFNWCPYCSAHVWVSPSTPVGAKIECYWCQGQFGRVI